jgi:hypothetical protein
MPEISMNHDVLGDQQDATPNFGRPTPQTWQGSGRLLRDDGGVRLFARKVALECAAAGDNTRVNRPIRGHRQANSEENTSVRREQGAD